MYLDLQTSAQSRSGNNPKRHNSSNSNRNNLKKPKETL